MEQPITPSLVSELRISLIQADLAWENRERNLERFTEQMVRIGASSDLVMLPETFSTGFTMQVSIHGEREEESKALDWMVRMAARYRCHVAGSVIVGTQGGFVNRFLWVGPGGVEERYDKRHLFRMGRENESFLPGNDRKILTLGGFRFLPLICYDLRFPVFARNRNDYDALLVVANWPAARQVVWETLLRARALENQAWVLAVNRTGRDGLGVDHAGGSTVISPRGEIVACLDEREGILQARIGLEEVRSFREKFPVWKDADDFRLT
ncbi:MAG: amidohydrolase [Bacteroidales bacterium]